MGERRDQSFFVRQATGLVRQFSALDIFAWSIIFFPWLTSWASIFWLTPDFYQNVNYYASLGAWSVIAMVIVLLYWQLTVVMPRSGGDYIFVSRVLSSPLGFVASFLFFVAVLIAAGSGSFWAFSEAGTQISFAGQVLNDQGLTSLGELINPATSSNPALLMAAALAVLAAGAAVVIAGGRVFKYVIYGFFAYGVITLLAVLAIFLGSSHEQFVSAYNSYFQGGVSTVLGDASKQGYSPGTTLANLWWVVPVLFVSIGPYPVMQFVGGEIRNPRRSLAYGLIFAEAVSIGIWFALTYVLDSVIGIPFIEAWTVANGFSGTVPTAFATVLNPNTTLLWFIVVGLFIGNIGWSWLALVFIGRLFLAWSFDRVIPSFFAKVSDRFHTPVVATVAGAAMAVIPMYLIFFTSFITTQFNGIFLYSVVWFLAAVTAIVIPFRRREMYRAAVGRVGKVPLLSVLGMLGAALFAYLAYSSIFNPAVGTFGWVTQIFTGTVIAIPVVIYGLSFYYHKRNGVDLRLLHSQIPPE